VAALKFGRVVHGVRGAAVLALGLALAGCIPRPAEPLQNFEPEAFDTMSTNFSRHYEVPPSNACEAARRALLSQGYVLSTASGEQVTGRKFFQPNAETHVPLEMRIVCAPEGGEDASVVFAVAVQEMHAVRKANNSASLGVGGLGSLSLPVQGSNDGMVKVGTQTVSDPRFYRSFFDLLSEYLDQP
jgi:hypothetical protein